MESPPEPSKTIGTRDVDRAQQVARSVVNLWRCHRIQLLVISTHGVRQPSVGCCARAGIELQNHFQQPHASDAGLSKDLILGHGSDVFFSATTASFQLKLTTSRSDCFEARIALVPTTKRFGANRTWLKAKCSSLGAGVEVGMSGQPTKFLLGLFLGSLSSACFAQPAQTPPDRLDLQNQQYTPLRMGTLGVRRVFSPPPINPYAPAYTQSSIGRQRDILFSYLLSDPNSAQAQTIVSEVTPDDGTDGLTLEVATHILLRENLEIKAAAEKVCQADADVLTARLRANPSFYADVQQIPYGSFSPSIQGGPTQYDVYLAIPLDLSRKRSRRSTSAQLGSMAAGANYRNDVRKQIDNLYTVFVDALAAQATLQRASVAKSSLEPQTESKLNEAQKPMIVDAQSLTSTMKDAQDAKEEAVHLLATMLNIPRGAEHSLQLRGTLLDQQPPPPPVESLVSLAMVRRPDLISKRLALRQSQADISAVRANKWDDVTLQVQPYTYQEGRPFDQKSATSWSMAVNVPLPIFNKQQGNLAKAGSIVRQTTLELAMLDRDVMEDVQTAYKNWQSTKEDSEAQFAELQKKGLPKFFGRPGERKLSELGPPEVGQMAQMLNEQKATQFKTALLKYHATIIEHRKSMLRLNTAVWYPVFK